MITGNQNNTYKYVAPYVLTRKNCHYDYRECPDYLAGDGPAVMNVSIVHSNIYNGRWIYFAWVELEDLTDCPREILMEFDQDELFDTAQGAWNDQEKYAQALSATRYKYARCYHHSAKSKKTLFLGRRNPGKRWAEILKRFYLHNFLAKKHQASALQLPARPENTPGGNTQPARLLGRGQL